MCAVGDCGRRGTKPWKELGYIRPQSNVSDYQALSGPFHYYCLSLPQIFVALSLLAFFSEARLKIEIVMTGMFFFLSWKTTSIRIINAPLKNDS